MSPTAAATGAVKELAARMSGVLVVASTGRRRRSGWPHPAGRELWQRLHAFSPGTSNLAFPSLGEEGQSLVRAAYGGHYHRPAAIRAKYDPANLFRSNQNIPPADAAQRGAT